MKEGGCARGSGRDLMVGFIGRRVGHKSVEGGKQRMNEWERIDMVWYSCLLM